MEHDRLDEVFRYVSEEYAYASHLKKVAGQDFCGVYIVGSVYGKPLKIGVAKNPIWRLRSLQSGNPVQLFIHRVFWAKGGAEAAYEVEQTAHRQSSTNSTRLVGEWFMLDLATASANIEMAFAMCGVSGFDAIPHDDRYERPQTFDLIAANDN